MDMEFNLESEVQFLGLFDFHIEVLDFRNIWLVLDRNNHFKGYIKKVSSQLDDGSFQNAYHTVVNDQTFSCNNYRYSDDKDFSFKIRFYDQKDVSIDVRLGSNSKLVVWKKNRELGHLVVSDKSIDLSYNLLTPNYKVKKDIIINDVDETYESIKGQKAYAYRMAYTPKSGPLAEREFHQQCGCVEVNDTYVSFLISLNNPDVITNVNKMMLTKGTVEDAFKSHKEGIQSLQYFRNMILECCPFKEDIVSIMIENSSLGQKLDIFEKEKRFFIGG